MRRVLSPLPLAVLCAVAALVALLVYGVAQSEPDRDIDDALARGEREPAPALTLPQLEGGGRGGLADYRGQVVVLNFWASWCKPCREESPLLEKWQKRTAAGGGTVLGVDALDVTGDALDFIGEYGLSYPMLKDRDGEAMASYGVAQLPETFVIDRRGRIAAIRRGPVDEAFMRAEVAPLLEGS
ncbi:MAG TPA: TlpA disulfide reductase family protein [Thermoleophilaceae bacterium]|jgi:cytochrome c biogenesis protein CcmG/thiol:disulfide interchange protein DsbE|nr:TlpA disulfide reductase family protein [Thermoleophilaceae bacterium]